MATLEARLAADPDMQRRMGEAHKSYATYRWSLLSQEDREQVESKGWVAALRDVGIAGATRSTALPWLQLASLRSRRPVDLTRCHPPPPFLCLHLCLPCCDPLFLSSSISTFLSIAPLWHRRHP